MDNPEVIDVTPALPTLDNDTRSKVKTAAVAATAAIAGLLAIDRGVKWFRNRKVVEVPVVATPAPSTEAPSV